VRYDPDDFTKGVILDALSEGMAATWLRRARDFEAAMPREGDFAGRSTREQLRRRWRECLEIAQACRCKAELGDPMECVEALADALAEAS
jgi:hypothetical protein